MKSTRKRWLWPMFIPVYALVLLPVAPIRDVLGTMLALLGATFCGRALFGWSARKDSPREIRGMLISGAGTFGLSHVTMNAGRDLEAGEAALAIASFALLVPPTPVQLRSRSA